MASSVLFTGGSSSSVYHGQWIALSSLQVVALAAYHGQWLVLSSLQVVALALSTMDNGYLCPLYRW